MELSDRERNELLRLIEYRYGYDFSGYAEASLQRRISRFTELYKVETFFDLRHQLLNTHAFFDQFIKEITVNVTEMFRDPSFFTCLQEKVFPVLDTYPLCKLWHAGCSTGEEVYSMAILLQEQELYRKSRIYATDINPEALETAREGMYPLKFMRDYTNNYLQVGNRSLSDYYTANYDTAILKRSLKEHMIFALHNLASDTSFNEFNLIICRNVLIYFNKELQERVIQLFYDSLCIFGYLALGPKESLQFSKFERKFEMIDHQERIYRKVE